MDKIVKTAFVVLKKDDQILLIQEGKGSAIGFWGLPGGHVDDNSSLEDTAINETKEEAGFDIEIERFLVKKVLSPVGYYIEADKITRHPKSDHEVNIFLAEVVGGQMKAGEEEMGIGWFSFSEIKKLPMRWEWLPEYLKDNKIINNLL